MTKEKQNWLEKAPIPALPWLNFEVLLFAVIIILAIFSRFHDLDTRVMSHDESLHTYFSYNLFRGLGYEHNPMMHGPLQFHLLALSYFLFGVSDFTARIPAVLFSIATIYVLWYWRRYLGKAGMIAAAIMMLISPYMLYYGRYVRNEAFVGLYGVLTLYATLRYLESGLPKYIYLLSAATVLHFTVKETSFIYTAELLLFLGAYFIAQVMRKPWFDREFEYNGFIISMAVSAVAIISGLGYGFLSKNSGILGATETAVPAIPGTDASSLSTVAGFPLPALIVIGLGGLAIITALYFLFRGYGIDNLRQERSFDLMLIIVTMILPMLTPFPVKFLGGNPLDYSSEGMMYTLYFLVPISLIAIGIGWWWKKDIWGKAAILFYGIFILFYTTLFTNGTGFFTGLVGSLGYWLEQQGVQRGSQPWYYYLLIQMPIYEFLPFIASIVAIAIGPRMLKKAKEAAAADPENSAAANLPTTYSLLAWWSFISLIAFTAAGEKMPWLTYHITLPMILWGGWAIGALIDAVDWAGLKERKPLISLALLAVFTFSAIGVMLSLAGEPRPFQGQELEQLKVTTSFIFSVVGLVASTWGLIRLLESWPFKQVLLLNSLIVFGLLAILTSRAAIRATYETFDSGKEYLVYAHGYTGVKDVLQQVTELSQETTGGMDIIVGYDDDVSWPMSWYMRDFPNARFYGSAPTRDLRDIPAIIVGDNNFTKIEPIVGNYFYRFDYIRMVWPNQDYFGLTTERFKNAITDPALRSAIFDIWLNRDYTRYAEATGNNSTKESTWEPSDKMRLYIRKDIVSSVWQYGASPVETTIVNPYEKGAIQLSADNFFGFAGSEPGQFNAPRGIAVAPDGSVYVADSRNHRIQHFSADGQFISQWGSFGDNSVQAAPAGFMNEPWGVAVGPDGTVYVTDTWNHRVQKFSPDGRSLGMWGVFGLTDTPGALYGPRGIAVDNQGHVFVADTGNKRIVVYDSNGTVITSFGQEGALPGEFYEPVDVQVDALGNVYVTDTWNQRVQVLASFDGGTTYSPTLQWDVSGWSSQSLDNKPYLAVAPNGHVFITDPEGYRVIEFAADGTFIQTWGDYGTEDFAFNLPSGIAVNSAGQVLVADSGNNRIMRFTVPQK